MLAQFKFIWEKILLDDIYIPSSSLKASWTYSNLMFVLSDLKNFIYNKYERILVFFENFFTFEKLFANFNLFSYIRSELLQISLSLLSWIWWEIAKFFKRSISWITHRQKFMPVFCLKKCKVSILQPSSTLHRNRDAKKI